MAVETFEASPAGAKRLSRHGELKEASADLPDGVYTTFRTYDGRRVLRLDQHVRRLLESAALKGMPGALDADRVRSAVGAVLDATAFGQSRFRATFAPPRLFLSVEPFTPLPSRLYVEGAACVTLPLRRLNPRSKDTGFIATAYAAYRDLPPDIEEGLMLGDDGSVLEGLSSNVFAVRDSRIWTEEERVLLGVTRAIVLEVAADVLPVERTSVRLDDGVAELFITSVSREVMPVVTVDGRSIGSGRPGPLTREIARGVAELVEREAERL
jgi:branched-chain amino acid aminotransferase